MSTGTALGEALSTEQTGYIRTVAISLDNKILAAGSDNLSIILYNMDMQSVINQALRGHNGVSALNALYILHNHVIHRQSDL